jgi:hypothetical protein
MVVSYSQKCRLINADVNGSYNILRKAIPNAFSNGIGSCVVQPRRVNPLEVKKKGEGLHASHGTVIDDYTFTSYLSSSALVLGQQLHGVACWHDQS